MPMVENTGMAITENDFETEKYKRYLRALRAKYVGRLSSAVYLRKANELLQKEETFLENQRAKKALTNRRRRIKANVKKALERNQKFTMSIGRIDEAFKIEEFLKYISRLDRKLIVTGKQV